jgi:hypothetical protein
MFSIFLQNEKFGNYWQGFPEPNSTAAGSRMLQLMDLFLTQNYQITFLSTASISENSFDLNSKNIQFQNIVLNDNSFDDLIKSSILKLSFLIDSPQKNNSWRVSEQVPNAVKILDTEDLHFLRNAREKPLNKIKIENSDLINDVFKREIASILRCDLSLIISEFEMNMLKNQFKIDEKILFYLPLFAEIKNLKLFLKKKNFVSIGNFCTNQIGKLFFNSRKFGKTSKINFQKQKFIFMELMLRKKSSNCTTKRRFHHKRKSRKCRNCFQ